MRRSIDGFRPEAAAEGIDLEQLKQSDLGLTSHIHRLAHWQYANGLISRDTYASALEATLEHRLAHIADNPEVYRAARTTGYFDALRNSAGGWDRPDESAEAGEKRRRSAIQTVAAIGADMEFRQRHALAQNDEQRAGINQAYYSFMNQIQTPGEIDGLRHQFGDTSTIPGDLDGNLAEPPDTIKGALGAVIHHARTVDANILRVDNRQQAAAEPEHSGDWSPERTSAYMEKANAREAATRAENQELHSRPPSENKE